MTLIIIIVAVVLAAILAASLIRIRISRDMSKEHPDDSASILAYDQVSRWLLFDAIRWLIIRRLKSFHLKGLVVDAGCGPGYLVMDLTRRFPELDIVGIDISPEMLKLAEKNCRQQNLNNHVKFEIAAVERLPFETGSVDFVVSSLSLHHWLDPAPALQEIFRVLKPGGQTLIFDLRRDMPYLPFLVFHLGQRFLAPPGIKKTNGAVGSVWASFTPAEMATLLVKSPFQQRKVFVVWGWAWLWGMKNT
ncbi:MAG TPA: class I SAM-dependent methyltransferase [Dehalococcoidales bacterium]